MSTVLPDIHADLVPWNRHICLKRFDDFASWPYVIEHKDRHSREAKDPKPGHSKHIGEENKLGRENTSTSRLFFEKSTWIFLKKAPK